MPIRVRRSAEGSSQAPADRLLEDPDRASPRQRARASGLANVMNRVGAPPLVHGEAGRHRPSRSCSPISRRPRSNRWAKAASGLMAKKESAAKSVLFQTCYVQGNEPQIGRRHRRRFSRPQRRRHASCEKGLECCGMPAWEGGDLEGLLRKKAQHQPRPLVAARREAGSKVVAINPDVLDDAPPGVPRVTRRRRSRARQAACRSGASTRASFSGRFARKNGSTPTSRARQAIARRLSRAVPFERRRPGRLQRS